MCRWPLVLALAHRRQAASVGRVADGVIVGSALINAVDAGEDKLQAAAEFVQSLQVALQR